MLSQSRDVCESHRHHHKAVPSTVFLSLQSDNTDGSLEDLTEQSCKGYAQLVSQNGITAQARSESSMGETKGISG